MMQDRLREQFLRDQEALIEARLWRAQERDLRAAAQRRASPGWWIFPAAMIGVMCWAGIGLLLAEVL